jgi:hypothetical protein
MTVTGSLHRMQPYVIGLPEITDDLLAPSPLPDVLRFDPLDRDDSRFFRLVSAGNSMAFGPLAMPQWVQLDCCTLPGAMFGFAVPRADLPDGLWERLRARYRELFGFEMSSPIEDYVGWVPISEYCAISSPDGATAVGVSLYSLFPGAHLGLRSKAFSLACLEASRQVGATQYDNPAVSIHAAFGPLEIRAAQAVNHSHPERTFVYELKLPSVDALCAIARGALPATPDAPPTAQLLPIDDRTGTRVQALLSERHRLRIVPPGIVRRDGRPHILVN